MDTVSHTDLQSVHQPFYTTPQPISAAPLEPAREAVISPLSRIPLDIGQHRKALFDLQASVSFDRDAWERYWPYIDNVWCLHSKGDLNAHRPVSRKTEKFWGACRLQRVWKPQEGQSQPDGRQRTRREAGQCHAKFRITMTPDGVRTMERSKEGHSHDLEYIDSIKRNSAIRRLVLDPLFWGWDSGPILAYLKDVANAPPNAPDILDQAGGKYFDRREIINIFAQKMRAAHPSIDQTVLRRTKDKYEGVKTCNVKGCNKSFKDAKELARHKKDEHEQKKHDNSGKLYTCPRKECHRHKRSKGFATITALRSHVLKMRHWGLGGFHGNDGVRLVEVVTAEERTTAENGEAVEVEAEREQTGSRSANGDQLPIFSSPDASFFSTLQTEAEIHPLSMDATGDMISTSEVSAMDAQHGREIMMQRLQQLEAERLRMDQEMERLRNALLAG